MEPTTLRVLVIDDDASVRESIAELLSFLGHDVDEAGSGAAGLVLYERQHHDVVLTDLRMPGLSGWDVIEELRRLDPDVRTVLCTASATSAVIERARLAEVPVLFKPIRLDELQAVLRPRLRGASGVPTTIVPASGPVARAATLLVLAAGEAG